MVIRQTPGMMRRRMRDGGCDERGMDMVMRDMVVIIIIVVDRRGGRVRMRMRGCQSIMSTRGQSRRSSREGESFKRLRLLLRYYLGHWEKKQLLDIMSYYSFSRVFSNHYAERHDLNPLQQSKKKGEEEDYTIILRRRDPTRWLRFVPMISSAAASIDSGNESCPLFGFDECRRICRLAAVFCVLVALVGIAVSPADSSDASSLTADSVFRFRLVITLLGSSGRPSKLVCSSPAAVSVVDGTVEFSLKLDDDDDDDLLLDLGLDKSLLFMSICEVRRNLSGRTASTNSSVGRRILSRRLGSA